MVGNEDKQCDQTNRRSQKGIFKYVSPHGIYSLGTWYRETEILRMGLTKEFSH